MDIVGNIRIVEDSLAFILLFIALASLFSAGLRMQGIMVRFIPLSLAVGLIPLFVWKGLGMTRRVFVDKTVYPDLYNQMNHIGEVFESLSGLVIALSVVFILVKLRRMVLARGTRDRLANAQG